MPIRMNMCHDTQNPPGQVINKLPTVQDRPSHKGYPDFRPTVKSVQDFYDQWVFNQFFRTSEYDR